MLHSPPHFIAAFQKPQILHSKGLVVSPVCMHIHGKTSPRFLARGYKSYTLGMMQCGQSGAAQGTSPAAAEELAQLWEAD